MRAGQQELRLTRDKNGQRRGGRREGAGRPRLRGRRREAHQTRERFKRGVPVHVVTRVVKGMGSLRRRDAYRAVRVATLVAAKLPGAFRIVQLSLQGTHLHLLVEAAGAPALWRGMQSFLISAAKQLHRAARVRTGRKRRGRVFADRHHVRVLNTPREVRNALAYVLNNWRHHGEDRAGAARRWCVDPFSTGIGFDGWQERADKLWRFSVPAGYDPLFVWLPKSWLLSEGWRRHGLISFGEVPGGGPEPDAADAALPRTRMSRGGRPG